MVRLIKDSVPILKEAACYLSTQSTVDKVLLEIQI